MKLQTVKETAKAWEVHPSRVRVLCNQDRVPGAVKVGRDWLIPAGTKNPAGKPGRPKTS